MFFKDKSPSVQCSHCDTKLSAKNAFKVEYRFSDGTSEIILCEECADTLNEIINERDNTNDERI